MSYTPAIPSLLALWVNFNLRSLCLLFCTPYTVYESGGNISAHCFIEPAVVGVLQSAPATTLGSDAGCSAETE